MPFHTDYRPDSLEDFKGNRSVKDELKVLLRKENPPHSYLFYGPSGCGKTTLARIAAKELDIQGFNLKEQNAADFRGIDSIRDIIRKMRLSPLSGGNRGYILDEAHKLTPDAQNAILKALEDTPDHVFFFLCTTNPENLIDTVRSRLSDFEVGPLNNRQTVNLLEIVAAEEGTELEPDLATQIATVVEGTPRNALVLLEKVLGLPKRDRARVVKKHKTVERQSIDLARALIQRKSWKQIAEILKGLEKEEPENIRRTVLGYANTVLLGGDESAYLVMDAFRENFFNTGKPGLTLACYEALEPEE